MEAKLGEHRKVYSIILIETEIRQLASPNFLELNERNTYQILELSSLLIEFEKEVKAIFEILK